MIEPCPRCGQPALDAGAALVCDGCAHRWVPLARWEVLLRRWIVASGWVSHDFDDLVQEGLIAVWLNEPDTVPLGMTIAKRAMIDWFRVTYGCRKQAVCRRCRRPRQTADAERECECPLTAYPPPRRVANSAGLVRRWHSLDEPVDARRDDSDVFRQPVADDDVEAEAFARMLADDLRAAIAQLPVREREAVLVDVEGETLREVGARWGVSESGACLWRGAARRKLRAVA